jgi:hypothetical protein
MARRDAIHRHGRFWVAVGTLALGLASVVFDAWGPCREIGEHWDAFAACAAATYALFALRRELANRREGR